MRLGHYQVVNLLEELFVKLPEDVPLRKLSERLAIHLNLGQAEISVAEKLLPNSSLAFNRWSGGLTKVACLLKCVGVVKLLHLVQKFVFQHLTHRLRGRNYPENCVPMHHSKSLKHATTLIIGRLAAFKPLDEQFFVGLGCTKLQSAFNEHLSGRFSLKLLSPEQVDTNLKHLLVVAVLGLSGDISLNQSRN